jgi:hypothetical protein
VPIIGLTAPIPRDDFIREANRQGIIIRPDGTEVGVFQLGDYELRTLYQELDRRLAGLSKEERIEREPLWPYMAREYRCRYSANYGDKEEQCPSVE